MKKILFFLFFLIASTSKVYAASDLNIVCNSDECHYSSSNSLFNFQNISPGFLTQKNITVLNNRTDSCTFGFYLTNKNIQENSLASKINLNISKGSSVLYTSTLQDLYQGNLIKLDNLSSGDTNNYTWQASLSEDSDNNLVDLETKFDINLNFVCQDLSTSNNTQSSGGNNSPPVCTNSVPDAPTNFYTRRNTTGSVTLYWKHPSTPFTNYLVAYGTTPGVYLYGNPNVGNDDHYTVRSLTPGAQYCFYVRTINGCMPGGRTQELCVNSGSNIVPNTNPPTGFQPNVLGAETTEPAEITQSQNKPSVAGATSKNFNQIIYYILSLLFLLISASYIYRYFRHRKSKH